MVTFDNTPDIVNASDETYGKMPNLNTPVADEMVGLRDNTKMMQLTGSAMRKLVTGAQKMDKIQEPC